MLAWKRKGNARPGSGKNQTIQMRIELIKHPMRESCGVEHGMTAVHHMIVEGQNHERGIGDDSTEHARIHRVKIGGFRVHRLAQTRERLFRREGGGWFCVGHRRFDSTAENSSRTVAAV